MSNIEKISAYLEGEMPEGERLQFEQALEKDAELRSEFNLQKDIVEGIKEARRLEIKAMLDKIPVGGSSIGGSLTLGKIISGVAIVGMVSLGIYYFASDNEDVKQNTDEQTEVLDQSNESIADADNATTHVEETADKKTEETQQLAKREKEEVKEQPKVTQEVEINKPSEAPMFETGDSDSLEAPTNEIVDKIEGSVSSLDVEIDNTRKKYSFHYQFSQGKLFLYGDFNKGLYEILEFKTTSNKMLFLYYKDKFYPLDKKQVKITELKPVKEPSLIEKLEKIVNTNQE